MKRSGSLTIRTASPERGRVQIVVEDTGEGIPPEIRERIFDPFFTTRPDGTGLGLSNCHRIVEAHEGSIHVEDGPARGTRVQVLLPAWRGPGGE
jgi:signal transduction histidine kinase